MNFHQILYLSIFRKSVLKVQGELTSEKNKGTLHEDQYRGADKSLARTGRKKATATEEFYVHISYL